MLTNTQTKKADFLIIGQGLAGSILANELLDRGCKVVVADNQHVSSSSMVAAGLYNPVVFKRYVESWMAQEVLPVADEKYKQIEKKLNTSFYFKKNIHKIFSSEDEKALWIKKCPELLYLNKEFVNKDKLSSAINNSYGAGEVLQAGFMDVQVFLEEYKKFLVSKDLLKTSKVKYDAIEVKPEGVSWNNINADKIIFCEGHAAISNPFFSWLPFKLTKGELLTIKAENLKTDKIINRGVFVLPLGNDIYKIGATYEWNDLTEETTLRGKNELEEKLKLLIGTSFSVIEHQAGIRPTVTDRRPLIGEHPQHKNVLIFNGFGTKGVMLAPYFSAQLADFLLNDKSINAEADIKRYTTT